MPLSVDIWVIEYWYYGCSEGMFSWVWADILSIVFMTAARFVVKNVINIILCMYVIHQTPHLRMTL